MRAPGHSRPGMSALGHLVPTSASVNKRDVFSRKASCSKFPITLSDGMSCKKCFCANLLNASSRSARRLRRSRIASSSLIARCRPAVCGGSISLRGLGRRCSRV